MFGIAREVTHSPLAGRARAWHPVSVAGGDETETRSLTSSRYLPRSALLRWSHDRVFFQIDDLNVLCTQLLPRVAAAARERRLTAAVGRARVIRTAATWSRDATLAGVRAYLGE